MIVWVLVVKILVTSPLGNKPMPYLAFENQMECVSVQQSLPPNYKSDCVAFAADITK